MADDRAQFGRAVRELAPRSVPARAVLVELATQFRLVALAAASSAARVVGRRALHCTDRAAATGR